MTTTPAGPGAIHPLIAHSLPLGIGPDPAFGSTDDGLHVTESDGGAHQLPNSSPIVMTRAGERQAAGRVGHRAHVEAGHYATERRAEVNTVHELMPAVDIELEERRFLLSNGTHSKPRRRPRFVDLADDWIAGTLSMALTASPQKIVGRNAAGARYRTTIRLVPATGQLATFCLGPTEGSVQSASSGVPGGAFLMQADRTATTATPLDTLTMMHSGSLWVAPVGGGAGPHFLTWYSEIVWDDTAIVRRHADD